MNIFTSYFQAGHDLLYLFVIYFAGLPINRIAYITPNYGHLSNTVLQRLRKDAVVVKFKWFISVVCSIGSSETAEDLDFSLALPGYDPGLQRSNSLRIPNRFT
jgi:hypothetical protein